MSYQVKKTIVMLVIDVIIFGIYYWIVFQRYSNSTFNMEEEMKFWAWSMIFLIPVMIVGKIVLYILYSIVNTIITSEKEISIKDELDRLIELKSSRVGHFFFSIGFILAMVALLLDQTVTVMFNIFLVSMMISVMSENISQLYFRKDY